MEHRRFPLLAVAFWSIKYFHHRRADPLVSGAVHNLKTLYENWGYRGLPLMLSVRAHQYMSPEQSPTSVWDKKWDLLIVLDACRFDWMKSVASEYEFIQNVEPAWSVGAHSTEWIEKTLGHESTEDLSNVAYISGNHFADTAKKSELNYFENLNEFLPSTMDFPVPPANVTTDRAIRYGRQNDSCRVIVHYMQPHTPFFKIERPRNSPSLIGEWTSGRGPFQRVFTGDWTKEQLIEAFLENLRYVLNEVRELLHNFDAENVIISSDHGEAVGEDFLYSHFPKVNHYSMREVPVVQATASDERTISPPEYEHQGYEVKSKLEALGYITN